MNCPRCDRCDGLVVTTFDDQIDTFERCVNCGWRRMPEFIDNWKDARCLRCLLNIVHCECHRTRSGRPRKVAVMG